MKDFCSFFKIIISKGKFKRKIFKERRKATRALYQKMHGGEN